VPVINDGKLTGIVQLGDIFDIVAALLFDEEQEGVKEWLTKQLHF
jgi:hypothetical protein